MRSIFLFLLFCQFSYGQKDVVLTFGQQLIYENKHDEAIIYFNKQLNQTTDFNRRSLFYLELAEVYKLKLDYNSSSTYYIKAFETIRKSGNIQLEFYYYVKMAEFYRKRALHKDAAVQLNKATEISKKHSIKEAYLAKYYNRKAALFTEHFHNQDSTLFYAEKSLEIAKRIDDKDVFFYSTLEIANVYNQRKTYKKAISYFEDLIVFASENHLIQHQADVYVNYTRALVNDKQLDKALKALFTALEFAKQNDLLYHENIFTINIYLIYRDQKNFKKANEYLESRVELSEKYYQAEHSKFLFDLEEKYKVSEKVNQIEINKLELSNKDKELATNQIRFFVTLGLFLLAILLVLLIAYFLQKAKSTNKELQFLSQQNEFLLSEANHRINNNLQLIVILISVQLSKMPENEGQEIKKILKKINSIATLHRHLYQSGDKRHVNSYKYLKDIQISFTDLFSEHNIKTNFEIESIELSADVSMYLGLLLTELCINSIKYAFVTQDKKVIDFKLKKEGDAFSFYYADNGVGMGSVKPKLIDQLCRQLQVTYTIESENRFLFAFKKDIK